MGVGIDVGFRQIRAVALDAARREVAYDSIAVPARFSASEGMAAAEALARRMLTRAASNQCAAAVAVSMGQGRVDPARPSDGTESPTPTLPEWGELAADLRDLLGVPVVVDNNARCAARAELVRGAGRPYSDFLYFRLHSGVGGAVVLDGEARAGSSGGGGELGHITLDPNGPLCRCGNRGCLEAYAGVPAVLTSLQSFVPAPDSVADLLTLLAAGNPPSHRAVIEAAHTIGRVAAGLCNALGPQAVILGGALTEAGDLLTEEVARSMRASSLKINSDVAVLTGALGPRASVLGAATLALTAAI